MSKRTFKDFLQADINNVFANEDEFAEKALINGVEMTIVKDSNGIEENSSSKKLALFDVVFHVSASNFTHIPQPEKLMNFNSKKYEIKSVDEDMSMLRIALKRLDA